MVKAQLLALTTASSSQTYRCNNKKNPTRLDAVTCCYLLRAPALFLHPFLQRGAKRNQSSWFKRGKSRGATAGVLFPKYQECLDHTRHFQRGIGNVQLVGHPLGKRLGVLSKTPPSASLLPPRRRLPTSPQGCLSMRKGGWKGGGFFGCVFVVFF